MQFVVALFTLLCCLFLSENGKDMQILHYDVNDTYAVQYDNYNATSRPVHGGHRIATILIYLSSVTRGGETIFPLSTVSVLFLNKNLIITDLANDHMFSLFGS